MPPSVEVRVVDEVSPALLIECISLERQVVDAAPGCHGTGLDPCVHKEKWWSVSEMKVEHFGSCMTPTSDQDLRSVMSGKWILYCLP